MKIALLLLVGIVWGCEAVPSGDVDWFQVGKDAIKDLKEPYVNKRRAKNVILFIGDGMGISTITAARLLKGELNNDTSGIEKNLVYEDFPHAALSKTYSQTRQVASSAATATALLSGVKTTMGIVGMNRHQPLMNCTNMENNKATSILRWSQLAGKATGVISTARITHATPAAAYAHSVHRDYEASLMHGNAEDMATGCTDIATQLVQGPAGKDLNVALGGGLRNFQPKSTTGSARQDDRDLIQTWKDIKSNTGKSYSFVTTRDELQGVDTENTDYLLGLFTPSHMAYELARNPAEEPSVAEMTEAAINVLKKDDDGFMLVVEGGRVDHAHHDSLAKHALMDTLALEKAVEKAASMTSTDDTLIIVTADHSHVFTIGGYPTRGNPILGVGDDDEWYVPYDGKKATTLSYSNGPKGLMPGTDRSDPTNDIVEGDDYVFESLVPNEYETHGGEDVGIYASGPMSHMIRGVMEQHVVAHVMAYAACVGDYAACDWQQGDEEQPPPAACSAAGMAGMAGNGIWMAALVLAKLMALF